MIRNAGIKVRGKSHLENLGTDRKIILEWTLSKQGAKVWVEFNWLRTRQNGGLF
jgi:hypothetical protein